MVDGYDIILFNEFFTELGPADFDIDFEIGDSEALNNFELTTNEQSIYGLYIPHTELGGVIEYTSQISMDNKITYRGWTWRGLLSQVIVTPPEGEDYKIVSGEANAILTEMLSGVLGGFFHVPATDSGCNIDSYQFTLYTTLLDGLMDMLLTQNYRLNIHAEKDAPGGSVQVWVEAVPATIIEGYFNEDSGLDMTYINNQMGINHLICMGSGELQERMRVDLYVAKNGRIVRTPYYTGFDERQQYYDFPNAQSEQELVRYGTQRLKEVKSSKRLEVSAPTETALEVGDIVIGRLGTGSTASSAPIVRKILKITGTGDSVEYQTKE